jgi:Domain of unknown function (DUF4476)
MWLLFWDCLITVPSTALQIRSFNFFYLLIIFIQQMNRFYKKWLSLFAFLSFFMLRSFSQQNHFIYLQTENKQPFYVKLDKEILSSSASGYIIIPKLQDGTYILAIGFPKNEWPEQTVTCTVNKKDAGYLLKNFGDKGWGIFNLQTMEVTTSGVKAVEKENVGVEDKNDIFSNTLSNVVNDPSIARKIEEKPIVKEEVKPALVENKTEVLPDTLSNSVIAPVEEKKVEDKPVIKEEVKPVVEIIKKEEQVIASSQVKKLFSIKSSEGTDMVFADIVNGVADTVRLFIAAEKNNEAIQPEKKIVKPATDLPKNEEVKKDESKIKVSSVKTTKADEPKFIDIELPNPNIKKDTALKILVPVAGVNKTEQIPVSEKPKENTTKPVMVNSDCKSLATQDDFLKLRKKMAAEGTDEEMVDIAKKVFRSKCFTTEQIKNLSVLFLKDDGKYKFFDAAYPFVSDSNNFSSLEAQLSDVYFITRFKAMVNH